MVTKEATLEERISKIASGFDESDDYLTNRHGKFSFEKVAKFIEKKMPKELESYLNFFETIRWPSISGMVIAQDVNSVMSEYDKLKQKKKEIGTHLKYLEFVTKELGPILEELDSYSPRFTSQFGNKLMLYSDLPPFINDNEERIVQFTEHQKKEFDVLKENLEALGEFAKVLDSKNFTHTYGGISQLLASVLCCDPGIFPKYIVPVRENSDKIEDLAKLSIEGNQKTKYIMEDTLKPLHFDIIGSDSKLTSDYLDMIKSVVNSGQNEIIRGISDKICNLFGKDSWKVDFKIGQKEALYKMFDNVNKCAPLAAECEVAAAQWLKKDSSKELLHKMVNDSLYHMLEDINLDSVENPAIQFEYLKKISKNLDKVLDQYKDGERDRYDIDYHFGKVVAGLGDYAVPFFDNLRPNFSKFKMKRMISNFTENYDYTTSMLKGTNFEIDSNKKVEEMFKHIGLLSVANCFDIDLTDWADKINIKNANNYLVGKIKSKIGENCEFQDILDLQPYLKYIKADDNFSKFLISVLGKEKQSNRDYSLPSFEVKIKFEEKADLNELHEQLSGYVQQFKEVTDKELNIETFDNLDTCQKFAMQMYEGLKEWKSQNAEKLGSYRAQIKEIEPNLERIMKMRETETKEGKICFDPYNFKEQLMALEKVQSCLSPGGCNFHYTKHYFADTDGIFWAVIKTDQGIVGRATVATGYDSETGQKRVSLASGENYSLIPLSKNEIARAVKSYADHIGTTFMEQGEIKVPGIYNGAMNHGGAYDDFLGPAMENDLVKVGSTAISTLT